MNFIKYDLDEAILGAGVYSNSPVLVIFDEHKILDILQTRERMDEDIAWDFYTKLLILENE